MGVGRAGSGEGGAGGAETSIEFEDGIRAIRGFGLGDGTRAIRVSGLGDGIRPIRGSGLGDGGEGNLPWGVARLFAMPFRRPSPVMEPCFAGSFPRAMGW